ncbi:MAG TPA: hypothetical protein VMV86_01970 [Methanosarcinales archaeon]|nr:hypothetical protein [Methanosarcinales archaeon]
MNTKRKIMLAVVAVVFLVAGCSTLNLDFRKLDTMDKKYQFAQEEWLDALTQYKAFMATQTEEQKDALHDKFDEAIQAVDKALDVWGGMLTGPTEYASFLEAKNALLRLGFAQFYKEDK